MKRRILTRIVIALVGLWLILLGVLYISSGKYRDAAIRILSTQLNGRLATEIRIRKSNIHLSFIREFPHAVIQLDSLLIRSALDMNRAHFAFRGADTLLYANRLSLVFDLGSLLTEKYELREVKIDEAKLFLLSDRQGNENYHILKEGEADTTVSHFEMNLQSLVLKNTQLVYSHRGSDLQVSAQIDESVLKGKFTETGFHVNAELNTKKLVYAKGDLYFAHTGSDYLKMELQEEAEQLHFEDVLLRLYGIPITGNGSYTYADAQYKFQLSARNAPLKKLDTSFAEFYSDYVTLIPLKGEADLDFQLNGKGSNTPYYRAAYTIRNASFREPESRVKLERLYASGSVSNGKWRNANSTHIVVDTLYCASGDSRLAVSASVRNTNRPEINAAIDGDIDLQKLAVVPGVLEKLSMKGRVEGGFQVTGVLPAIKNIQARDLSMAKARGVIRFSDASFESVNGAFPKLLVNGECGVTSLANLQLNKLLVQTGRSRLSVTGEASNLPFFTRNATSFPSLTCTIEAEEFHVTDFISEDVEDDETPYAVQFPDSVILSANISVANFYYGRFSANKVQARVSYQPGKLRVSRFAMNTLDGSVQGDFNIQEKTKKIAATCDAQFNKVNIRDLFYDFHDFGQDVITHNYLAGKLSGQVHVAAAWTHQLEPIYEELKVNSSLQVDNGELIRYPTLLSLSDFIAVEELEHVRFDRMNARVDVQDEKVVIGETHINSSALSLITSGEHDFENRYAYRFQVYLADVLWKRAQRNKPANTEFGYIEDDGLGRTMLPILLSGVDTTFRVSYDRSTARANLRQKVQQEKATWRKLLGKDENEAEPQEPSVHVDVEGGEELEDHSSEKKVQPPPKEEGKEEEFQVIWDDE